GASKDKVTGLTTDDFPVEGVGWYEAMDFCRIVSLLVVRNKGWVVDLPTEAEWEYACRAGTTTAFYQGKTLSSRQAHFNDRDRVFLAGASAGGELTLLTAIASNRFRAAASCSGGGGGDGVCDQL